MHNFIETILRKFKASRVNSLQNKSIRRNQIENHPIQTVVCFITVYCVLYLPFFCGKHSRFEDEYHTCMDAWVSTLPWNDQLHCELSSLFNTQPENKIFDS